MQARREHIMEASGCSPLWPVSFVAAAGIAAVFFSTCCSVARCSPVASLRSVQAAGARGVFHQSFSFPWQLRVCRDQSPRPLQVSLASRGGWRRASRAAAPLSAAASVSGICGVIACP